MKYGGIQNGVPGLHACTNCGPARRGRHNIYLICLVPPRRGTPLSHDVLSVLGAAEGLPGLIQVEIKVSVKTGSGASQLCADLGPV